jgi:hypothetical protein
VEGSEKVMTLGWAEDYRMGKNTGKKGDRYEYTAGFNKFLLEFSAGLPFYVHYLLLLCCQVLLLN